MKKLIVISVLCGIVSALCLAFGIIHGRFETICNGITYAVLSATFVMLYRFERRWTPPPQNDAVWPDTEHLGCGEKEEGE